VRALFLLARTLQRGEAAGAGAFVLIERAADGELASVAALGRGLVARVSGLLRGFGALGRGDGREFARCRAGAAARGFLAVSLVVTRWMGSLLVDVPATDPATFCSVAAVLAAAALLACWIPARVAAKTDPMTALRSE